MEIFCAVVEQGSFTAAAQQLGITPAAVSRAIARQEEAFEVRLLQRTTRSMTLTDAGRGYYEQCRQALSLLQEAERGLSLQQREPRGSVRFSAPTTYAHHRLGPVLAAFAERYPQVQLELNISNQNVDFVFDRTSLAVRRGLLHDSSLVARKLEDATVGVFASPAYLARRGVPQRPAELAQHDCISFVLPSTGKAVAWGFMGVDGEPLAWAPPDRIRCSGDFLGCVELARHGAGVVQAYHFLVQEDLRAGRLVEVLQPYAGRSAPFSLLRPARRLPLAVRLLADMVVAHCTARSLAGGKKIAPFQAAL